MCDTLDSKYTWPHVGMINPKSNFFDKPGKRLLQKPSKRLLLLAHLRYSTDI